MPEVQPLPSPNPSHRRYKPKQRTLRQRRFGPSILGEPSPMIPGSTTTEHEILFWVGCFYRLHQRRKRLIPVQLKTLDCPVEKQDGSPVIGSDGQPARMRCVREVAFDESRGQARWMLIEYAVGVPGLRFCPCASLDEAMDRFNTAPEVVRLA